MALTDEDFDKLGSLRGMRVFAATIQEIVNDPSRDNDSFEDKIKEALEAQLTAREREVLGLMAQGLSNKEIEDTLVLTAGAVSKHVSNVFMKLGFRPEDANRRVKAVLAWLRHTER